MFRELTRKNKQLSEEECLQILHAQTRGVLSVMGDDGYPYGMPMNFLYNEDDGCLWFHCGTGGHREDALKRCDKVSFCVYESGTKADDDWAYTVRSVIVFGKAELIRDRVAIEEIATKLSRKFTQDEDYIRREIDAFAERTVLIRLTPEHMCGKHVKEA